MNQITSGHVSYQPIHDMQFKGLHWIEASAGTGKTYTLSSLMVRLLLGDYLPHQVIATTFTRAAAAELKTRIRLRLQDTLRFLSPYRGQSIEDIVTAAQQQQDPLYQKILLDYADKMAYACERLKLVVDQFDELFVGTLDSFSQKLLREFSFESGKIEHANLTDQTQQYTLQLIHDVLREWMQEQPQANIDYLLLNGRLKPADAYVDVVQTSLNFASAHMQAVEPHFLDSTQLQAALHTLASLKSTDVLELEPYYAGPFTSNFSSHVLEKPEGNLRKTFTEWLPSIIADLQHEDALAVFFNRHFQETLKRVFNLFLDTSGKPRKTTFKKADKVCRAEDQAVFLNHRVIVAIKQLIEAQQIFQQQLDQVETQLKYFLAQEVKRRLPQRLQQKGETTFSQQIRTLAEALQGQAGQQFAQAVHQRYPFILVDEFQDTNQDQDAMLQAIWRHPNRYAQGGMIMVGDPKQAIYGFRGGDMLTYNKARQQIMAQQGCCYSLGFNHRSVGPLVEVVDQLFQMQTDFGEQVFYQPVKVGPRAHAALIDHGEINPTPLRWLTVEKAEDEPLQVAWQIRALLNQGIEGQLYFDGQNQVQALQAEDIAVLSFGHDNLDKVQYELQRIGIQVSRASKRSVFESAIAQDVAALLTAILHPFDEAIVKRALLSRLLGLNLQQLQQLETKPEGLIQFIRQFDQIRELWLQKGFLSAWQFSLNLFNVWENLVRYRHRDNERAVVNLRHVSEILTQHSKSYPAVQSLYQWYLKQLTEPAQRDWEMERGLSNHGGVQLMTIHQSKGLEFKFVFLMGASSSSPERNKTLNFSTLEVQHPLNGQTEIQRVVAIADKTIDEAALQQHQARLQAEKHRLWYVALTRASYRVYAILQRKNLEKTEGLLFWKNARSGFQHPLSVEASSLSSCPVQKFAANIEKPAIYALALPNKRFYPRGKTSFSGLSQHLTRQHAIDALAAQRELHNNAIDETHVLSAVGQEVSQPLAWIKRQFPMGTTAGNFLHEIFEHIDFQDSQDWGLELHRRFKNAYPLLWQELMQKYQQEFGPVSDDQAAASLIAMLIEWLEDILATPLHDEFCLQQLKAEQHVAEFPFYLSLADHVLAVNRIHALFQEYGIEMLSLNAANSARYLTGSIDLVYFDGMRYHIADYKSNFLGPDQQDYSQLKIQANMSQSSYWLQAGLYLVALHRYLTVSLEDYCMERHLGGASYLYLRGMQAQALHGVHYWKPSDEFILRLDALLGSYKAN